MRFHITREFSAARSAHAAAYAAWDEISDNPDPQIADHSPEAKAASQAECEALDAVLSFGATTPAEIQAKLAFMREREIDSCATGHAAWMEQIERELIELQRPCVSPSMAQAFDAWREAWTTFIESPDDDHKARISGETFIALMDAPCFTPGDFITKVYVNQLGEHGHTLGDEDAGAFPFELDQRHLTGSGGTHDDAAQVALARDIRECDLGRCMLALGRVDFDPADWVAAAQRAQMVVYVAIHRDGTRWLCTSEPDGDANEGHGDRFITCQALIAGGLGVVGQARRQAVIEHIIEHAPTLLLDCRECAEAAA